MLKAAAAGVSGLRDLAAEAFERQSELTGPVRSSADAVEGARAFTEKRAPVWTGS